MLKNNIIFLLRATVFALVLLFPLQSYAAPGATIVSRGVENAYGELPDADGYADVTLQSRVNSHLRAAANELQNAVKGKQEVNYSYKIVKNSANFLSIIIKADSKGIYLDSRSVNLDPRTGNAYGLNELFVANDQFMSTTQEELGWLPEQNSPFAIGEEGLIFVRPTDGQLMTVAYPKLFSWVDIGKSVYYLEGYYISEASDNKLLRIKPGNVVVLKLESNKSSGYIWQSEQSDYEPTLKFMGSSYLISTALIGTNGWDLLIYGAVQQGETTVSMQYKRSWQNDVVKKVKVQIIVEE